MPERYAREFRRAVCERLVPGEPGQRSSCATSPWMSSAVWSAVRPVDCLAQPRVLVSLRRAL